MEGLFASLQIIQKIKLLMATLAPLLTNLMGPSQEDISKSKKSLTIYQSKRVIDNLENSLEQDNVEEGNSSILTLNRQICSGMIVDAKQFDQDSKIKKQIVCRNGEENQKVIFSFITLEEDKGKATKAIYRWVRRPFYEPGINHGITITEEEHIYQGEMLENRKHGDGEYIIIQKLSNATEKNTRYMGTWNLDIFVRGTMEDESGMKREIKQTSISFKSKSNFRGKSDRNETIKQIALGMEKKKEKSSKFIAELIPSNVSICDKVKNKKTSRVVIV